MACFCGCEIYEKDENGFKMACVKCGHGPQNHDEESRARVKKENQKSKSDADLDRIYSPIILQDSFWSSTIKFTIENLFPWTKI